MEFAIARLIVLALTATLYEGHGILNLVEIGKDYKLEEVKEITEFTAFYAETADGDNLIWFALEIAPNAVVSSPGKGLAPTLVLMREKEVVAAIGLRVGNVNRQTKDIGQVMEWKVSADFAKSSHCMFQLQHSSDDFTTFVVPFSTAKATHVSKDRQTTELSFSALRTKILSSNK
jgi:hypothetical protein